MKIYHWIMRALHWTPDKKSPSYIYHNNKLKGLIAVIAVALFFFTQSTTADYLDEEMKTIQVSESLLQSTVIIKTAVQEGTGFYISPNEIITSAHVMGDQTTVFIKKGNGQSCFAELVYKQSDTDLALLKTDCEGKPIPLAESVKVGQSVLAMGNPLYQEFFVSKGIVGLVNSNGVLHDAPIDSGMSGGPVVNLSGELVGVTKASAKDMPRMSIAIDIKTLSYFLYKAKEE